MPRPRTSIATAICQYGVSASSRDSRYRPSAITAEPTTGKILYRPVRPTTVPDSSDMTSRPSDHRQGLQARLGRRRALHVLQVGGQERHRPEHREPDDEGERDADVEHRGTEQPQRQDRVDRPALHEHEDHQRHAATRRSSR